MSATATSFKQEMETILNLETAKFRKKTGEKIAYNLLRDRLIKDIKKFPETVVQTYIPWSVYYHVMHEIGIIGKNRYFFENAFYNSENIGLYRQIEDQSPVKVDDVEVTANIAEKIIRFLDESRPEEKPNKIIMPQGFYVFRFKSKPNGLPAKIITVTPLQATSLKSAIRTLYERISNLLPCYYEYKYLSDFLVCSADGWHRLRGTIRKHARDFEANITDYDLKVA